MPRKLLLLALAAAVIRGRPTGGLSRFTQLLRWVCLRRYTTVGR